MSTLINRVLTVSAIVAAALLVAAVATAEVANSYAGQVILFSKRPPSRWNNDSVFHAFVRANRINTVQDGANGNWRIEYMAFFKRPVGDREVSVRFFDANDTSGRYLTSYELYLDDPRQRIAGGSVDLERPDFQPNRYYKIVVASQGKTLAQLTKFALVGKEPERSGEVNFTVEDTRGP
jgi:hypothetical protein